MAGDDDYFGDDDFDDDLLNAIDVIEQNYASTQLPQTGTAGFKSFAQQINHEPPPAKRPRTEEWKQPASRNQPRSASSATSRPSAYQEPDEFELPDISIGDDGGYCLTQGRSLATSTPFAPKQSNYPKQQPNVIHGPPSTSNGGVVPRPSSKPVMERSRSGSGRTFKQYLHNSLSSQQRQISPQPLATPPGSQQAVVQPPANRTPSGSSNSSSSRVVSSNGKHSLSQTGLRQPIKLNDLENKATTGAEVENLRQQLALLQTETASLKQSLREAEEAKLIKEGEASTVRRLMEKQVQGHAEAIARLKAEKQQTATAGTTLEGQLRAEIDALKTRLTFKQHEVELAKKSGWANTSTRTGVRISERSSLGLIQTPRKSNYGSPRGSAYAGSSGNRKPTPIDTRLGSQNRRLSPEKGGLSRRTTNQAFEKRQDQPQFPSFYNSFKSTSPVKKRSAFLKEKLDALPPSPRATTPKTPHSARSNGGDVSPNKAFDDDDRPVTEFAQSSPVTVDFGLFDDSGQSFIPGAQNNIWKIDWRQELHSILFGHMFADFSQRPFVDPDLTVQMLVSLQFPGGTTTETIKRFQRYCALFLGAFAAHGPDFGWPPLVDDVAEGLLGCLAVLLQTKLFSQMIPLFDLLASVMISIPECSSAFLLQTTPSSIEEDSLLISTICELVKLKFTPPADHLKEGVKSMDKLPADWEWEKEKADLGKAILKLMEALCWVCPDDSILRLQKFCSAPCILNLVDSAQPGWFVDRATRLLVFLSTHPPLFESLLGSYIPQSERPDGEGPVRIPLIERLSSFLAIPHRWATDVERMSITQHITTFFASLTEANSEGVNLLIDAQSVIPSLIACVWRLSMRIWEDDKGLAESSEETQIDVINTLHPALHLLWHLVNPAGGSVNVRLKIQQATIRDPLTYNGLHHLFIAGIGRLSYASPPEGLCKVVTECLERMNDLARELLDSVVEGPECDAIWEAYQDGDEQEEDGYGHGLNISAEEEQMAMAVDLLDDEM